MIKAIRATGADIKQGTVYMPIANRKDWFRCTTVCRPPTKATLVGKLVGRRGRGEGHGGHRNIFYNSTPVYIRVS